MPIYKADGKKDGLQKYNVRVNYLEKSTGKAKQLTRVAYGLEQAKELEMKLNYELKENQTGNISFMELYEEYARNQKHEVRETTYERTFRTIDTYILPTFKDTKLKKITLQSLQKWKLYIEELHIQGKPLGIEYKRFIFSKFRALLNYAVKMEYIPSNPLSKLGNFKDVTIVHKDVDYYTSEEFLQFIKAAKDSAIEAESKTGNISEWNYYVFFNIAFYTGMRKGEIHALRWSDIKDNTINITRSISQKVKGGDRETPPKNKSSVRSIQIPLPLQEILQEHYKRYRSVKEFTTSYHICGGERCIRDSTIDNRNAKYSTLAGVKKIRIHDFRHSHASLLANSGINIQEVARRLGHSNIEMTWNIYSHLYPKEEERALEVLNQIRI